MDVILNFNQQKMGKYFLEGNIKYYNIKEKYGGKKAPGVIIWNALQISPKFTRLMFT